MKVAIASDHGGYTLKKNLYDYLLGKGYEIVDYGTDSSDSCDYPIYAKRVVDAILKDKFDRGILVCGTGIGMAMAANRHKGIRAANVDNQYCAKMAREHNNSNVLTLGARVIGEALAVEIVDTWLEAKFLEGRHKKRIDMLD